MERGRGWAATQSFGCGKVDEVGIVVGFGDVGEDEKACSSVESLAVSQVFADDVVGKVAGAAHDALLDVPGIRADLEHFEVVIGFENEAIGVAKMKFDELSKIAEVGDDGDFCSARTECVTDRVGGIVRDGERRNFDIADGEAFTGANVLDAVDFFRGGFGKNAADFNASAFGEVSGGVEMREKLRKAAGVIGVFMGNENAVEAFGRLAESGEAAESFFAAEAGVNEERSAVGFQKRGVAGAA